MALLKAIEYNCGLKVPQNSQTHLISYLAPMRYMKWFGLAAAVLLTISCFTPWVIIESRHITVSGVDASGTNYGKPGYFHFVLVFMFLVCTVVPKVGFKRLNLFVTALNLGWAIRNFFVLSTCSGGECPARQMGLWLALMASVIMLVSALFPDMKIPAKKTD
jgi:hypothetical protein